MTRKQYDLSKIDYKVSGAIRGNFCFKDFVFITIIFFSEKKHKVMVSELLNGDTITYSLPSGAKELRIRINLDSLIKEKVLDDKDGIYNILIDVIAKSKNKIPFSISIPEYEVTTFGDTERKYISPSAYDIMLQSLQMALGVDLSLQIKLKFDFPIKFEDISNAVNIEYREQALRKFGYENYIKEGFDKSHVEKIIESDGNEITHTYYPTYCSEAAYHNAYYIQELSRAVYKRNEERIIVLRDGIAFLQVKDSSTGKTYFLKVPPDMRDVQEAKAWTFGLSKKQYKPLMEA